MLAFAGCLALAIASVTNTCKHFIEFERNEVGDIDDAIGAMAPRSKVCALIYDKGSRIMNNQPFLHFGSYYQVEKGGVVEFTYAGYAHWPVDFLAGHYPPPGKPARLQVDQEHVVFGAAADDSKPALGQPLRQSVRIGDHLFLIFTEVRLAGLPEAHRLRGDYVFERPALGAGEHDAVEILGVLGAA